MNVLPLTFSLLIVITVASTAFFEQRLDTKRFTNSYSQSHQADRNIIKQINHDNFSELKSQLAQKPPINHTESANKKDKSPRQSEKKNEPRHCARLNLFALLDLEDPKLDVRYELCLKFFHSYYSNITLIKNHHSQKILGKLLDAILYSAKTLKEKNEPICIEKLDLNNAHLQQIFYKMLKGTNNYEFGTQTGYPALTEYISVEIGEDKICFPHASKEILSILFSQQVANDIYQAYLETSYINKIKLNEILQKNSIALEEKVKDLIIHTHKITTKKEKKTYKGQDDKHLFIKNQTVYRDQQ